MSTPHSQWPWEPWFDTAADGRINQAGVDDLGRKANVCLTCCENIVIDDQNEFNRLVRADTHLIAAAPELLAAMEEILSVRPDDNGDRILPSGFLNSARAAVAKARGEQAC